MNGCGYRDFRTKSFSHAKMKTYNNTHPTHIIYNARNGSIDKCDFMIILERSQT